MDFASLRDRVKALRVELGEIQLLNDHYLKQTVHDVKEQQAHTRRRERLEQIIHELTELKAQGRPSVYRKTK